MKSIDKNQEKEAFKKRIYPQGAIEFLIKTCLEIKKQNEGVFLRIKNKDLLSKAGFHYRLSEAEEKELEGEELSEIEKLKVENEKLREDISDLIGALVKSTNKMMVSIDSYKDSGITELELKILKKDKNGGNKERAKFIKEIWEDEQIALTFSKGNSMEDLVKLYKQLAKRKESNIPVDSIHLDGKSKEQIVDLLDKLGRLGEIFEPKRGIVCFI